MVGVHGSDDGLQRDLNLREERCGSKLNSLGFFSCSWATGHATRCSSYDTCYASVLMRHSDTVREANASVLRWRKSWLVVARMEWEELCGSKLDSLGCFSCSWATGYVTRCSSYDTCYASVFTKHSDTVREANASVVRWCKSCLVAARMEWEEWCGSKLDSLGCFSSSWATGYATRCSSYDTCYASVLTKCSDTVREANASVVRWCKSCLVAAKMECMAKAISAVKDVTWLLFDDSLDLGLQLGRINAVSGRIHRMIKTGQLSIDDDDEKLGNDDDPKFKMMGSRRGKVA